MFDWYQIVDIILMMNVGGAHWAPTDSDTENCYYALVVRFSSYSHALLSSLSHSCVVPSQCLCLFLRDDELLHVVDRLFSHHDDQQLLGQFNETSTRSTL